MAIFNEHVIVNSGRELLGRALAGEGKIIITRAAMGDGKPNKDIKELTSLVSEKIVANVVNIFNDRGTVNLKVQITNSELEAPFKTEEFGIFAKIEGDKQEVLYSYCTAIAADTIPSNHGDVFIEEHTVYIAFSSDAEADIYIKEGVVFLSIETANQNYVRTGLIVEGKLSNGRTSLKENYQYQADNGKWYHNIGGNRSWRAGNGVPDELLLEISYFDIHKRLNTKLAQGNVSEEYNTGKKIEDKIKDLEQRFKNFCPYLVGDIYITTNSSNPSAKYLGTTWQKIEGRFLLGTSNSQASKLTGGSMNKNISQANLPNVKLTVDNFSLGRGNMDITGSFRQAGKSETETKHANGAFKVVAGAHYTGSQWGARNDGPAFDFKASRAWTGTTNSASPQTNALGNGQALDITPAYYTTHMWLRTS